MSSTLFWSKSKTVIQILFMFVYVFIYFLIIMLTNYYVTFSIKLMLPDASLSELKLSKRIVTSSIWFILGKKKKYIIYVYIYLLTQNILKTGIKISPFTQSWQSYWKIEFGLFILFSMQKLISIKYHRNTARVKTRTMYFIVLTRCLHRVCRNWSHNIVFESRSTWI